MLKNRLIGCLVVKNGIVVQSINFKKFLPVGKPEIAVEFLNNWGIDEIVLLDIDASREQRSPDVNMIERVAQKCFVPLTIGGGIRSIDDMRQVIHYGADKVSINTLAIEQPEKIQQAAEVLGNQCLVASIDVRKTESGYEVFKHNGQVATGQNVYDVAQKFETLGAGEIFLNSIDQDGSKKGYDLELIQSVAQQVKIPVIACGGVGHPQDFVDGLKQGGASAVAAANYFHFTEHSPVVTKAFMHKENIETRMDTYAEYTGFEFDSLGRVNRQSDDYLQKLRFELIKPEVI